MRGARPDCIKDPIVIFRRKFLTNYNFFRVANLNMYLDDIEYNYDWL